MKKFLTSNFFNIISLLIFDLIFIFLRSLQLIFFTDYNFRSYNYEKSFSFLIFNVDGKFLTILLYCLTIAYFLILFFSIYKNKNFNNIDSDYILKNNNINLKIWSIISSLGFLIFSFFYIFDLKDLKGKGNNYMLYNIIFIFQILTSLFFLYFFYCLQTKKFNKKSSLNIVFTFPIILIVLRLWIFNSSKYFHIITPRELMFLILRVASIGFFLLYFAKFINSDFSVKNKKNMIVTAFFAIFITIGHIVPKIISYLYNYISSNKNESKSYIYMVDILKGYNFVLSDFMFAVFILFFLINYIFCYKIKKTI